MGVICGDQEDRVCIIRLGVHDSRVKEVISVLTPC